MEDQHFNEIIRPFNQISLLIDDGSTTVFHILLFLKISIFLSSLDKQTFHDHNGKLIESQKLDKNHELNLWFDHHVAYKEWCGERMAILVFQSIFT